MELRLGDHSTGEAGSGHKKGDACGKSGISKIVDVYLNKAAPRLYRTPGPDVGLALHEVSIKGLFTVPDCRVVCAL